MDKKLRIIAVDPGYGRLGVAVIEQEASSQSLVFSDCIVTSAKENHSERLNDISQTLEKIFVEYKPTELAIEKLYFSKNRKTALLVAEARGVVLSKAKGLGLEVFEYSPAAVKIAVTGHGGSDKKQVQTMVERILALDKSKKLDDEYDAIAIGLTHLAERNFIRG
jgi:crossover junction endodeoxyribonuclease RuvC